jgi:hypothetical protein
MSFNVGLSASLADYLILRDFSTLKILEPTDIPVPRAFGLGLSRERPTMA